MATTEELGRLAIKLNRLFELGKTNVRPINPLLSALQLLIEGKFPPLRQDIMKATRAARFLRSRNEVRDVWLFGSLSRSAGGNDLDFMLEVGTPLVIEFYRRLHASGSDDYKSVTSKTTRQTVAFELLHITDSDLLQYGLYSADWDIFFAVPNWKDRLMEMRNYLGDPDPSFIDRVAAEARWFNPSASTFTETVRGMPLAR